jgi:hypothetical protein
LSLVFFAGGLNPALLVTITSPDFSTTVIAQDVFILSYLFVESAVIITRPFVWGK